MTVAGILLILFLFAGSDARAIQPASASDVKTIQGLLNNAVSVEADVLNAQIRSDKAEAVSRLSPNDPALKSQAAYSRRVLENFVRERDLIRDKAIHRALTAYGIVPVEGPSGTPKMPSGTAVVSNYAGQITHWRVVAQDDTERINLNTHGDRIHEMPVSNLDARAATDGSGITIIFEKAFSSPAYLALILPMRKSISTNTRRKAARTNCP